MTIELVCNRWLIEFPALGIIDRQSLFEPLQTGVLFTDSIVPFDTRQTRPYFHDFSFNFNFDGFRISAFLRFSLFTFFIFHDFHHFSFSAFSCFHDFTFHDFRFSRFSWFLFNLIFKIFSFSRFFIKTLFSRFYYFPFKKKAQIGLFWIKCWWIDEVYART